MRWLDHLFQDPNVWIAALIAAIPVGIVIHLLMPPVARFISSVSNSYKQSREKAMQLRVQQIHAMASDGTLLIIQFIRAFGLFVVAIMVTMFGLVIALASAAVTDLGYKWQYTPAVMMGLIILQTMVGYAFDKHLKIAKAARSEYIDIHKL